MTKYEDIIEELTELSKEAIVHYGQLSIKGDGGSIDLHANGNTIGIWMTPKSAVNGKPCVSIYHYGNEGTVIGIYGPDQKNKGLTIALSVGKDGVANLQVCKGEDIEIVDLMDLVKAYKMFCPAEDRVDVR